VANNPGSEAKLVREKYDMAPMGVWGVGHSDPHISKFILRKLKIGRSGRIFQSKISAPTTRRRLPEG